MYRAIKTFSWFHYKNDISLSLFCILDHSLWLFPKLLLSCWLKSVKEGWNDVLWLFHVSCVLLYPMYSHMRSKRFLSVSPIYLCLHVGLLHFFIYIIFLLDLQFMLLFRSHEKVLPSTIYLSLMYGHIRKFFPNFVMPFSLLFCVGLVLGAI